MIGWDYYRNLNRADFDTQLNLGEMFETHAFFRNDVSRDLYFVGRKKGGTAPGLTLDVARLGDELCSTNSLVVADRPFHLTRSLGDAWALPLRIAQWLPDPLFQNFVRFWTGAEQTIRRIVGR